MNILFMSDAPENPNAGAAGTEIQTAEALRNLGHNVDAVWAHDLPHRIKHGNLHYLVELPLAYRQRMLLSLKHKHYDVVHVTESHGYLAAKALGHLNRRAVFIHRSHGLEMRVHSDLAPWKEKYSNDVRSLPMRAISRLMTRALSHNWLKIATFADGHIVSSQQCGNFLREEMGVPGGRIAVIPQAAPDMFVSTPAMEMSPERLRRILYVGQFAFFKAPIVVAEVMGRLLDNSREMECTWVCSRKHHDEVRRLLPQYNRDRVELLDWMPQEELIKIYDQHGIFLFPSFFEGFGKAFLEAMSRGLCVIASNNGGARDIIIDGVNGMLLPAGCSEAFVNNCLELIETRQRAARMSIAAAETAKHFSWRRVAKETVAFYEKCLRQKTKSVALYA